MRISRRITIRKPIVVIKAGKSERAAQSAASHTGSMVGADTVWDAAFRQSGIVRVNSGEELGDVAIAFASLPLMRGRKIGMVTISGGLGVLAVDSCHRHGLEMAELSLRSLERINALAPPWQGMGNPADMWPACMVQKRPLTKVLSESIGAEMDDPNVDAVLLAWGITNYPDSTHICQVLTDLLHVHKEKPLVCCFHGSYASEAKKTLEATGRTVVFSSTDRAIRALGYLAQYSAFRFGF